VESQVHERRLIDAGELADEFGVTRQTILTWRRDGLIPCEIVGRTYRFDLQAVRESRRQPARRLMGSEVGR
jgi:excisionase family DNA binding protein